MLDVDRDPTALRLRDAVWAEPDADAPRMVYADYLLEHDDPLGELIALQLERARTGTAIGERELELVVEHGRRLLGPLNIRLTRFVFERGFLAAATPVADRIAPELVDHPLWSTVERLQLSASAWHNVLDSAHLRSLRALHLPESLAVAMARRSEPLAIRALTSASPHRGLRLEDAVLPVLDHAGVFDRVRALSLDAWRLERALAVLPVFETRLCAQLEHLDLTFESVRLDDIRLWRNWFETTRLARLSIQVPLGQASHEVDLEPGPFHGPAYYLYAEIERGSATVNVQLHEPTPPELVGAAVRVVAELGGDRRRAILEDVRDSHAWATRHPGLVTELGAVFGEVRPVVGPVRRRSP